MRALGFTPWLVVAAVLGTGLQAHANPASDEDWRFIQTGPSHRLWLNSEQVLDLSRLMHVQGRCGGFMDITDDAPQAYAMTPSPLATQSMNQQAVLKDLLPNVSGERMRATVEHLTSFHNRFFKSPEGVEAATWIRDEMQRIAGDRDDIEVELVEHSFAQPSVVARIKGNGALANQKIIVGGHLDSINWSRIIPTRWDHAPGADDNASGIAVVLEAFSTIVESGIRPQRTIEFMGYAAEEIGLRGSNAIARSYRSQGADVVGVMQLDMTMFPGTTHKLTFINDNTSSALNRFTQRVSDTYLEIPWQESHCGYACSDHASWDKAGYATVFPFESAFSEANPHIHSVDDTMDKLDTEFATDFAKLAVAFLVEGAQTAK